MSAFGLTTIPPSRSSSGGKGKGNGAGPPPSKKPPTANGTGSNHLKNTSSQRHNKNFSNNNRFQNNRAQDNGKPRQVSNRGGRNNRAAKTNNETLVVPPLVVVSSEASDPEYVVQTKLLPSKANMMPPPSKIHDQFIGPLFKNPEKLGYTRLPFKQQELPNYLIHEQKFLDTHDFKPDQWDLSNQQRMLELEQSVQDTNELLEILEKMRDVERTEMENRGLVDKANVSKSLADAIVFRGSCLYMCPVFEKVKRGINGDTSKYERDPSTNTVTVNSAIKAFSRSEAGQAPQLPSDVRPPHILVQTLDYMIANLLDRLPESESFIWNRTRSIRQDFTYQNYFGPEAVYCMEKICRIHILTLHIMANSDVEYSQQQELEQLNKSLETLNEIYDDLKKLGKNSSNEAEFRAYYVLSYYNKPELDQLIQNLSTEIFEHPLLQMAIMFRGYLLQNNTTERDNLPGAFNFFSQFFKACFHHETPFLMSCLLEVHFNEVRFYALKSMSNSFHSSGKPYLASQLSETLGFDEVDQLVKFVEYYEMNTLTDNDQLCVQVSNFKFNFVKDKEKMKQSYSKRLDAKVMGKSYKEIIDEGMVISSSYVPPPAMKKTIQPPLKLTPLNVVAPDPPSVLQVQRLQPVLQVPSLLSHQPSSVPPQQPVPKQQQQQQQQQKMVTAPVIPKKKKITELPQYHLALDQLYNEIILQTVDEELSKLISSMVQKEKTTRQRQSLIENLSKELYGAFMNEAIHLAVLEIQAQKFRELKLERFLIRLIKPVALESLQKAKDKREKIEEYNDFKNRVNNNNKRINADNSSMVKETLKKKMKTLSSVEKINYNDLWEPVDLEQDFIDQLPPIDKDRKISLNFLIIVKDWNELSSKWLINKLQLKPNGTKTTFQNKLYKENISIKMTGLPDRFQEVKFLQKATFILFEIGKTNIGDSMTLEKKLKFDSKVMYKILEYVEKNCKYQVQILVLYYDATRSALSMLAIEKILKLRKLRESKYVADVKIYDMSLKQDLSITLTNSLKLMAQNFVLKQVVNEQKSEEIDDVGMDSTMMNNTTSSQYDEVSKLKKLKRLQYIKSTLSLGQQQPKIHLKSSTSFANKSQTTINTSMADPSLSFSKFNNNDIYQFQDTTFIKPYLTTSTPNFQHARDISMMSNNNSRITSVGQDNSKKDALTKAIELRKLAASVLQNRNKRN